MKSDVTKESLEKVLTCMFKGIEKENADLYKSLKEKINVQTKDLEDFYFSLLYPFEKLMSGLISVEISNNKGIEFIYMHSQFIERHFQRFIQDIEGSPCCADKSRTIIKRLVKWFLKGERIEFDYTQEYTFHLPKKVFKTHDEIIRFYEGIESLYYGYPLKYMEALLDMKLTQSQKIETPKKKGTENV